jgi:hypothetical protein
VPVCSEEFLRFTRHQALIKTLPTRTGRCSLFIAPALIIFGAADLRQIVVQTAADDAVR